MKRFVFTGPELARLSGLTYAAVNLYATSGLLTPSVRSAGGSGVHRRYSFADVVAATIAMRLRRAKCSNESLRAVVRHVQAMGASALLDGGASDIVLLLSDSGRILAERSGEFGATLRAHGEGVARVVVLDVIVADVKAKAMALREQTAPVDD